MSFPVLPHPISVSAFTFHTPFLLFHFATNATYEFCKRFLFWLVPPTSDHIFITYTRRTCQCFTIIFLFFSPSAIWAIQLIFKCITITLCPFFFSPPLHDVGSWMCTYIFSLLNVVSSGSDGRSMVKIQSQSQRLSNSQWLFHPSNAGLRVQLLPNMEGRQAAEDASEADLQAYVIVPPSPASDREIKKQSIWYS